MARDTYRWQRDFLVFVSVVALGIGRVAAQSDPAAVDDASGPEAGESQIQVDEEITVIGQRSRTQLRLEVQLARERVYDLFNTLNSSDDLDIVCRYVAAIGTRIRQRVCRPRYVDEATSDAGGEFVRSVQFDCAGGILQEGCIAAGNSRARAAMSGVPLRNQQLDDEIQRLARDNAQFRRAIVEHQIAERRYEEARREVTAGLRVSASIVETDSRSLPSSASPRRNGIVAPRPLELATPEAPWNETRAGAVREGWVKLRFSVLANGATADLRVVDTMPPEFDVSSVVMAAASWRFEPATAGGAAIDWHNNLAVITVSREQDVHVGWADFADAYEAVAALAAASRYEEAKSRNEAMRQELAATNEEMAFAQMQLAGIEHALGDPHAALEAIRRATEPAVDQLADEELKLALGHRFALEIELGLAADALRTYRQMTAFGGVSETMARAGAAIERTVAAPEARLAARGRVDGTGQWSYALMWRVFAVGDVDGRIDGLWVKCHRNEARLPFEADVQMTIPAGWGACVLLVEGQPDTTLVVHELQEILN